MAWFRRDVVLLARRVRAPQSSADERRQWVLALGSHPGFQLLVAELNNRRIGSENELAAFTRSVNFKGTPEEIRHIYRLQEQAFWAGWLQHKLVSAAGLQKWLESQQIPEDNLG